jgi:hypothetical protein
LLRIRYPVPGGPPVSELVREKSLLTRIRRSARRGRKHLP